MSNDGNATFLREMAAQTNKTETLSDLSALFTDMAALADKVTDPEVKAKLAVKIEAAKGKVELLRR